MKQAKNENTKTAVNLICSIGVLAASLLVSFFLSPYIIRTIGVEANGFVNLASNFTTYASLVVTALNAMASRFILFAYVNKDFERANLYYNSVFWGNLVIAAVCLLISILLVPNLNRFINVPGHLLGDVKILFFLVFLGFICRTGAPNWECATYITNRLDRTYIPTMVASIVRCLFFLSVFRIFTPRVWFTSIFSVISTIALLLVERKNARILTPELGISIKNPLCSWQVIKELVGSGIWNAISNAGNMLFNSFDLLICNLSLGATAMGVLSLAKVIPNIFVQLAESIRGAFGPELNVYFAKGDIDGMLRTMRRAMKLTSVTLTIPAAGIIVMSDSFYRLWVPTQNADQLRDLTILALMNYILTSGIVILYSTFTITNKVKCNSIAQLICGTFSIITTLILVRFTQWDLYAVAGVSCITGIIRDMCFTIPVTSRFIGVKWNTFYPQVGTSIICSAINICIGYIVRLIIPVDSWITFFVAVLFIAVLGLGANMMIVLNKEERTLLIGIARRKIFRSN